MNNTEVRSENHSALLDVIKELRSNNRLPSTCSGPGNVDYKEYYYDGGGSGYDRVDRYPQAWASGGSGPPGYRGPTSYLSYLYDRNGSSAGSVNDQSGASNSASNRVSTVVTDPGSTKTTPPTTS